MLNSSIIFLLTSFFWLNVKRDAHWNLKYCSGEIKQVHLFFLSRTRQEKHELHLCRVCPRAGEKEHCRSQKQEEEGGWQGRGGRLGWAWGCVLSSLSLNF